MHRYELLECLALISSVLVCVVLHPFLEVVVSVKRLDLGIGPFPVGDMMQGQAQVTILVFRNFRNFVNSVICH